MLFISLKDYWSGLAARISKSDDRFVRVRAILTIVSKRWLGFHEPAFLDIETILSEDWFARGLQRRDNLTVLKLKQYSAYVNLKIQFLVPDVDRLPHGMRIGESFGGSVGNCYRKAWSVEDHTPDSGNRTDLVQQALGSLGVK
jgi:hypothetical protein